MSWYETHPECLVRAVDPNEVIDKRRDDKIHYYCMFDNHIFEQGLRTHYNSVIKGYCGCKTCGAKIAYVKSRETMGEEGIKAAREKTSKAMKEKVKNGEWNHPMSGKTPEQKSVYAKKAMETMRKDGLVARAQKRLENTTHEQRSAWAKKSSETQRANKTAIFSDEAIKKKNINSHTKEANEKRVSKIDWSKYDMKQCHTEEATKKSKETKLKNNPNYFLDINKNVTKETRVNAAIKGSETKRKNGYYESDAFKEAHRKSAESALKNGTMFRSRLEVDIEQHYDGLFEHKVAYSIIDDKRIDKELDLYCASKNLAIEVDDPSHYERKDSSKDGKEQGYHYNKDKYFLDNFGIKILHITTNSPNPTYREGYESMWDVIDSFLDGTLDYSLLIMTNDPIYGEIVYPK